MEYEKELGGALEVRETDKDLRRLARDFKVRHGGPDLKKRSVRSGAVTLTAQATQLGLQTVSAAVLARLLIPQDFGIMAMVVAFTAFAEIFKDMGLSTATIQRKE